MPNLDLLVTFLEIHRSGSLTAAAARRGLTQPAVSGQLAKLEQELGTSLFVRSGRGVVPTAYADDLAARVGPHLDQLAVELSPGYSGTVRLGGPAELMSARIMPTVAPLTARGLRLNVTLGLAEDLLAALHDDQLDIVVSAVRPKRKGLVATTFVDEEFILVGPPPLARTVNVDRLADDPVKALAHLPLVAYDENLPIIRRYWRSEFGRRPPNATSITVPDLRSVLAAVIAGAGVSVLPRYIAEPALTAGSVEILHQAQVQPLNTAFLVTRPGGLADPSVALVHDQLKRRAGTWGTL
ncbi:LysR family transcriptional regulator [Kibdelosporangium aridum]|uniref:LysR family transcriptional regulator n=1 Tax=Kibdelosporangium aridum TaxID=2030 RepID=A0A428ZKR4_KIBAR|nr:LysR family transcriptional regulator [Kibdelosporangium aridum]RSM88551.1 LysR family transcriptional regulator [Kibdelosporangium aridum]